MSNTLDQHEASKLLLDTGLLFYINHHVLHPLGLALAVSEDDHGQMRLMGLYDYRSDPEGMVFEDETFMAGIEKYEAFMKSDGYERLMARFGLLGFIIQPRLTGGDKK